LLDLAILKKGNGLDFIKTKNMQPVVLFRVLQQQSRMKNKISMQMSCLSVDNIYGNQAKQCVEFSSFFMLGQLDEQRKFSKKKKKSQGISALAPLNGRRSLLKNALEF